MEICSVKYAENDETRPEHDLTAVRETSPSISARRRITAEFDTDVSRAVTIS